MLRPFLAVTLVACAGLLVWMLCADFGPGAEAPRGPEPGASTRARAESADELAGVVDGGAGAETTSTARPIALPGEELAPVAADEKDGVEVLVVLASGKPVRGARVRGLGLLERSREPDAQELVPIGLLDPEAELHGAPVFVTDAQGRTRVPRSTLPADYAASAGELWGTRYFSDSVAPPYVIELAADATFRLQIVDARGRPAGGVPVALGCSGSPRDELWSALADPLGELEVRHWAAARQKCLDPDDACIRPILLARDDAIPCLRRDIARATKAPTVLTLPPLGRVEVRVTDAEGHPLFAPDLVLFRAEDTESRYHGPARDAETFEPSSRTATGALFERVGLGLELRAWSRGVGFGLSGVTGPGPKSADETAVLELVVGEPRPALTGRLIANNGEPLRQVEAWLIEPDQTRLRVGVARPDFTTNAEGRFRFLIRQRPGTNVRSGSGLAIAVVDEHTLVHRLDLTLPDVLRVPENDLGDLRFAPMTLVASGQVVDERGRPANSAFVRAQALGPDGTDVTPAAHVYWPKQVGGAFEIFAEISDQRWLLTAAGEGCEVTQPLEIAPGSRGVRLVLGEGGTVRGSVVRGRFGKERLVAIFESRRELAETHAARFTRCPIGEDGGFSFASVHGGKYDLVVQPSGGGSIFARIEGVELVPGAECSDPRLQGIELRSSRVPEPSERPR